MADKKAFYPQVDSNPDFPKLEAKVLNFWQEQNCFTASVENRSSQKEGENNEFVFYDGPPFANGLPHYGHLLTGFVKDIFARYQTIKGKRVERRFGWDCHGLPAEMGAEKELNISGRHKIMEYGIDKFNDQCRTSVMKFSGEWEKYVQRQARWVDFENDYKTMDTGYMESVLWAFKQLYDKGLVYESMRVMPYSWACETPLSNFETRMDNSYRQRADKAVTVGFKLKEKPQGAPDADEYRLLAWTTTPWTLPSNLALAVGENIDYACVVVELPLPEGELPPLLPLPQGEGWGEGEQSQNYNKKLKDYARDLRKNSTDVEHTLWQLLRNRQLLGLKFYRQRPIGDYIVDFVTRELKIVIELDGGQHQEQKEYDAKRTEYLESQGYQVLRFWNNEVVENLEGVMQKLYDTLTLPLSQREREQSAASAPPLPEGEGEQTTKSVCYILAESSVESYAPDFNKDALFVSTWKNHEDKNIFINDSFNPKRLTEEERLSDFTGKNLVNLTYEPLFPYFVRHPNAFKVLAGDFVEEGDGTGIVHLAPGFGEDDQRVCADAGIELVCPVDNAGKFTAEIHKLPYSPLEGEWASQGQSPQASRGGYEEHTIDNAKKLRKEATKEENKLWQLLRDKKLDGFKFRRQQPIDKYIVDFFCPSANLIIEIDGSQHSEQKDYDEQRTAFLESKGYRVLRFWNNEVNQNIEGVFEKIQATLNTPHDSAAGNALALSTPPQGGSELSLYGRNVLECNDDIIKYLKAQGSWIKTEQYLHNYPHCWRTDTPLIYKAVPSWYVEVTKFKDRMVELNQQINWIPDHIKNGQFGKWLENARDWSISRNRFWGAPIPIWKSDNPNNKELYVFGSIAELEAFFETKVEDLHRPIIDELTKTDPFNPQYTLRRVEDVFDCWFESGSMPYAQVHYPFENKDWFEQHFPADFIVEYVAQTRGWFYTLMVLSTALFDRPPFLNCICHGVVLDDKGQKLSKRLNNYADPMEVFDRFGSDAMRWVMISAPIMHGGELLIDKEGNMVRDAVRLVLKPVWNAYHFFTLYANADGIEAKYHPSSDNLMDRYILAKCKDAVLDIEKAMDAYHTPEACKAVENFFEVLNNWYIRRSKERFWKSEHDADKEEAYNTLYSVLHIMCRAMSPMLPLLTETIWQGLCQECPSPRLRGEVGRGAAAENALPLPPSRMREGEHENALSLSEKESVHLADFPDLKHVEFEGHLMHDMDKVREVCNAALSIRNAENIRVRQPLSTLTVVDPNPSRLADYADIIKDEVNVKEVVFEGNVEAFAEHKLKINFPVLGKRLPEKMKQIIPASKKGEWKQLDDGKIEIIGEALEPEECQLLLEPKVQKGAQALSSNDALVMLDLDVTDQLKKEGIARDLVRMIQQSRKDADLNIADRIALNVTTSNDNVSTAVHDFKDYIAEQTLAVTLSTDKANGLTHRFEQMLDGNAIVIGFSVA